MLGTTCSLYDIYPEQNPFELHPPVYQLRPRAPKKWASDTQEFRDAARAIAERTAQNPLALCYGTNPLVVLDPESIDVECTQFPNYKPPPPLPQASLQGRMEFLERIHPSGHTPLFTVRVDGHVRLLKVFPDRPTSLHGYSKPEEAPPHPLKRFTREQAAYAHLLHYGACAKGAVPFCYGWLELSADDMDSIAAVPNLPEKSDLKTLKEDVGPPKALLLEYFEGAQPVTIDNVTAKLADLALRGMCAVHACYVAHCDISSRNVLVTPSGSVVWVDFDRAVMVDTQLCPLKRYMVFGELAQTWSYFYHGLLPDKRIGFRNWLQR